MTEKDTVFLAGGGDFDDLLKSSLENEEKETKKTIDVKEEGNNNELEKKLPEK